MNVSNKILSEFPPWKLLDATIDALKKEECNHSISRRWFLPCLLLSENTAENQVNKTASFNDVWFDGFNDFSEDTIGRLEKYNSVFSERDDKEVSPNEESVVKTLFNALRSLEGDTRRKPDLGHFLSQVNDNVLQSSLFQVWFRLDLLDDRQQFIKLLSPYITCTNVICRELLLPELQKEDNFQSFMEVVCPVLEWLHISAISELFMPLLRHKESFFSKETVWLKEISSSLSTTQKMAMLESFIGLMEENFQKNDLQVLSTLVEEIPINTFLNSRLISLLNNNLNTINDDRYLGKILLVIVTAYSTDISKNVTEELIKMCNSFNGIMKLKIKLTLEKVLKGTYT